MKYIITFALIAVLSGCGVKIPEEWNIRETGFSTLCLDGVSYYVHTSKDGRMGYMSVKLDRNSKIVQCETPK
jgi:hypothetical protein